MWTWFMWGWRSQSHMWLHWYRIWRNWLWNRFEIIFHFCKKSFEYQKRIYILKCISYLCYNDNSNYGFFFLHFVHISMGQIVNNFLFFFTENQQPYFFHWKSKLFVSNPPLGIKWSSPTVKQVWNYWPFFKMINWVS